VLQLDEEEDIDSHGNREQNESDDGQGADAAANCAEVFDELLLFEGIAVGGFADPLEVIFDAFEGCAVLDDLVTEFAVAGANLGETAFDRFEVDMHVLYGRGRRGMMAGLGGHQASDGGGEVAVEQGQEPLYKRNRGTDGLDGALQA
jgi:hypothetical protein